MTLEQMWAAMRDVQFRDWTFELEPYGADYELRVGFWEFDRTDNQAKRWHGRKWIVSRHATKSELIQTALKAVLTALEHEAREAFLYKGKAIFGPHFDVDFLSSYCDLTVMQDARPSPPTGPTYEPDTMNFTGER